MVDGETYRSLGEWAACETCADLIERGDREGLMEVSAKNHLNGLPILERDCSTTRFVSFTASFGTTGRERWKKDDADPAGRRLFGSMAQPGG